MECTQRLDFELSQTERICPEQIGFLGILGIKYPVKKGPNKIGRDPQTCSIVLNRNSISRQHAVINVLNGENYMLMDLDSANRTRLNNKVLQAYIPVPISNGDTVQFGEVFGIFRLLEEETDLPSTQAIHIPDTPASNKHGARFKHAVVPESPDVSDKDDSFIVPSQPKPQNKFKSPINSYIKTSSKTNAIQPIGSNKIDNVYWSSTKKSNSFSLDDSNISLNNSSQNGDIHEKEMQPSSPLNNESSESIYTAETQLPPQNSPSIHSQDTQLPASNLAANDNIFDADTQLPYGISPTDKNDESIYDANTQLPFGKPNEPNDDDIFEAETQLPPPYKKLSSNNNSKSIHEIDTQLPLSVNNESPDFIYTVETQLPKNASPTIYSQETQMPKLDDFVVRDSPKIIYDVNTQLPIEEPNVSNKKDDDIFNAETQLPGLPAQGKEIDDSNKHDKNTNDAVTKKSPEKNSNEISDAEIHVPSCQNLNVSMDVNYRSKDKSLDKLNKSDEVILFDEVEAQDFLEDGMDSQPILGGESVPFLQENDDIPLSQSDTITADFDIRLEDKATDSSPATKDTLTDPNKSTDCEDFYFLPTQKIPETLINEEDDTDCEEDKLDTKLPDKPLPSSNSNKNFEDMPTQLIPEAGPVSEFTANFEDLATQVIPDISIDDNIERIKNKDDAKIENDSNFEDMLTQVIPEDNGDTKFEDLPIQVLVTPEELRSKHNSKELLQFSEEVITSPFKIPLQTPIKIKRKEISKISDSKGAKTNTALGKPSTVNDDDEKYYAATQELFEDLCSQNESSKDLKTVNNNLLKNINTEFQDKDVVSPSSVADYKAGNKFPHLEGEIEITVNKLIRDKSSESSDGEDKVNKFVANLSNQQMSEVIGADVAMIKRAPSDPSDVEVTPKKVRPFKFMETLLPDSQEIKTNVTLSTKTITTDSSSESEQEKESQELTPIVFCKKKRVKADVKKDLTTQFDVEALPSRILTRPRKPTARLLESEAMSKKRSGNILNSKYSNDSQDEVDSEILTENITRLRNKNDKKMKKQTPGDGAEVAHVRTETVTRKSNEENVEASKRKSAEKGRNKSKNVSKDTVSDVTTLDDDGKKSRRKNEKSKSSKEIEKLKPVEIKPIEKNIHSPKKNDEPRKSGRSRRKDVQDKITNYTVSLTDESKVSNSTSKIDESLNAIRTRHSNREKSIKEKSVTIKEEVSKRKRGRSKKEINTDSKHEHTQDTKTEQKDNSKDTKRRKKEDVQEIEKEQEVRRSRRQRTAKDNDNSQSTCPNHEQSAVYNVSSESVGSPKRKLDMIDAEAPSSKRTRSMTGAIVMPSASSSNLSSKGSTLRSAAKTQYVLYTAFPYEEIKAKLQKLGAVTVTDVSACTVVLTASLRRTFKLLCAVGLGKPIVGSDWVQACVNNNSFVDPWQHLLQDSASEGRFKFSLARTLSGPRNYLKGYYVTATPSVLPSAPEMKLIVECSGGIWSEGPRGRWLAVSCMADRASHDDLRTRGATVVTSELILAGVLRQQLDIQMHLLK